MKGAGEPIFEHDFPPGSDMVGSIIDMYLILKSHSDFLYNKAVRIYFHFMM